MRVTPPHRRGSSCNNALPRWRRNRHARPVLAPANVRSGVSKDPTGKRASFASRLIAWSDPLFDDGLCLTGLGATYRSRGRSTLDFISGSCTCRP